MSHFLHNVPGYAFAPFLLCRRMASSHTLHTTKLPQLPRPGPQQTARSRLVRPFRLFFFSVCSCRGSRRAVAWHVVETPAGILEAQPSEIPPLPFSYLNSLEGVTMADNLIACAKTYTNPETHRSGQKCIYIPGTV